MDTVTPALSPSELLHHHGTAAAALIIDVRRAPAFAADATLVAGATWRDPFAVAEWEKYLPRHRPVAVYCVHGHEVSQNTCAALRAVGVDARFVEGGIEAWRALGAPLTRKCTAPVIPSASGAPSVWVTRERPRIDRIACPWLIRRFIDPFALFEFAPPAEVLERARPRCRLRRSAHPRRPHAGRRRCSG